MSLLNRLFGSSDKPESTNQLDWRTLASDDDLERLLTRSAEKPCLIFKHSSRCSISFMARKRLERNWDISNSDAEAWFLDLITFRSLSDRISQLFNIQHQSPQVILVKNGRAVYDASHGAITVPELRQALETDVVSD